MYSVYIHLTGDTDVPFYVGKGKGRRPFSIHNRNKHWKNIVAKHGFRVEIIAENLSEEHAYKLEQDTIVQFRARHVSLANYCDGGRGVPGLKFSLESRRKMSDSLKMRNANPTLAMMEARSKLSLAKKEAWRSPTPAMVEGARRSGKSRSGRTKKSHAGVAAMAEKMKKICSGAGNPNHKWVWCTPCGEFNSPRQAAAANSVGLKTVERRCKAEMPGWSRRKKL